MKDLPQIDSQLWFIVRAWAIGLLMAYGLSFLLKLLDLLADHLTWLGLTVGPAALFSILGSPFAGRLWFKERWWMFCFPVSFVALAVLFGLNMANWNR